MDGLTVDMGDWWFGRPSNTEPLLRLNLEPPTTTRLLGVDEVEPTSRLNRISRHAVNWCP